MRVRERDTGRVEKTSQSMDEIARLGRLAGRQAGRLAGGSRQAGVGESHTDETLHDPAY